MKLKTGVVAITYERVKEDSIHHILKKEKGRGGNSLVLEISTEEMQPVYSYVRLSM